jgi:iron complex transport system substrate-binding protein
MNLFSVARRLLVPIVLIALVATACGSSSLTGTPVVQPPATVAPNVLAGVEGVVDPTNRGWPREVEVLNGLVTIEAKPLRVLTVSLGHDEVVYALLPAEHIVAVGRFTQTVGQSNVAELASLVPAIGRDPEQIVAHSPDIVFASPFTKKELIESLENAGITVVQSRLHNDPEGRIADILLMGYILGEELRAVELASEVRDRYEALRSVVAGKQADSRPRVMSTARYSEKLYTAGAGSTEGAIIDAAGGLNVAAEAGLERNPVIDVEGIIAMSPEVIIITQPLDSAEEYKQDLLNNPALAEVPAIRDGRVLQVQPSFFTTLSFWNQRGAEELARLLWPDDFADKEFPPFSFPE